MKKKFRRTLMTTTQKSAELFQAAGELMPGGVNSPVRAWQAVGQTPRIMVRGEGARVFDVDGNSYLDYLGSWGPLILGHAAPPVVAAIAEAAARGTSFGAPTPAELDLARILCAAVPSLEMLRLVNSGTEATMSALRLARGVTGRPRVIKFDGNYHGHADSFLVAAGSGVLTHAIPGSPGVPGEIAQLTISLPYNDLGAVRQAVQKFPGEIAALIVEPVAGNMGVVPPEPGFLEGLRQVCDQEGIILIFDEVITGFRVDWGGAQAHYQVMPDLTCLGKIIGGGLPVGAYGGRRDLMSQMAPIGPVYQAGTLSGNPVAVAAGLATLQELVAPGTYPSLEEKGDWLARELTQAAKRRGIAVTINRVGSMLTLFFTGSTVRNLPEAKGSDLQKFRAFFQGMLAEGVYLPPSQFEAFFISQAHTPADLEYTVAAAQRVWSR
jgi:glutamate-1-semialdehyde 2,1-aminomutase